MAKRYNSLSLASPGVNQALFQITRIGMMTLSIINNLAHSLAPALPVLYPIHLIMELIHASSDVERVNVETLLTRKDRIFRLTLILLSISLVTTAILGILLAPAIFLTISPIMFGISFFLRALKAGVDCAKIIRDFSQNHAKLKDLAGPAFRFLFATGIAISFICLLSIPGAQVIAASLIIALVACDALTQLSAFLYKHLIAPDTEYELLEQQEDLNKLASTEEIVLKSSQNSSTFCRKFESFKSTKTENSADREQLITVAPQKAFCHIF